MELISIVIPTKNRLESLKKALSSVYEQTYKNLEIIIIDDGSTDETPEFLIKEQNLGKITFYRNEVSVGGGEARNIGIKQAKGDFIAFLDDDDVWFPTKLEKQLPLFVNPLVGIVYSGLELYFTDFNIRYESLPSIEGYIYNEMLIENRIGGTVSIILRAEIAKKYLFDSSMPARQDYDLWLRICKNWNVRVVREPLVLVYAGNTKRITSDVSNYEIAIEKINSKYYEEINTLHEKNKKRRRAEQTFFLGSQSIKANNIKSAKKYYFRSLLINFKLKTLIAFLATFFGIKAVLLIRKYKR